MSTKDAGGFEDLRYMWERHSRKYLATYIAKDILRAQPFYTCNVIASYIADANRQADFKQEYRNALPLIGALFRRWNFFTRQSLKIILRLLVWMRNKRIAWNRVHITPISILDIGCGSGNYYRVFKSAGLHPYLHYTGIDISEKNIENCKVFFPKERYPNAEFATGNIMELAYPDASFDVVVMLDVLEHLADDDAGSKEVARILKRGGLAIVAVPAFTPYVK